MAIQSDWEVWYNRWHSLDQAMLHWADNFPGSDGAESFQRATLVSLVNCLRSFAGDQFNFFYDGFGPQRQRKLTKSLAYPPEYAFSLTLDQVALDFEVMQNAAFQRLQDGSDLQKTLRVADQLAALALQPASKLFPVNKQPTVATYFQKSASIRLVPYATVALIGTPLSCVYNPRDYLAIPHEMGHYVYRHGLMPDSTQAIEKAVSDKTQSSPEYIKKWQEEIFADLYGCIVGGPVLALDFQDLQLEKSGKGFIEDDGGHPTPFLRPLIHKILLELLDPAGFQAQVLALDGDRNRKWNRRGSPSYFCTQTGQYIPSDTASDDLESVIKALRPLLGSVEAALASPQPQAGVLSRWPRDIPFVSGNEAKTLYTGFEARVTDIENAAAGAAANASAPSSTCILWSEWVSQFNLTPGNDGKIPVGDPEKESQPGWAPVLKAKGWTTHWAQSVH